MKFVYIVMAYPEDSVYPFTKHAKDRTYTHIYDIYTNMAEAVACVADIYERQTLGVKFGTEYAIIKRKVNAAEEASE